VEGNTIFKKVIDTRNTQEILVEKTHGKVHFGDGKLGIL
jgi:hypothetical protein